MIPCHRRVELIEQENDKYSAHSGLLGKQINHVDVAAVQEEEMALDSAAVTSNLIGQNGQDW